MIWELRDNIGRWMEVDIETNTAVAYGYTTSGGVRVDWTGPDRALRDFMELKGLNGSEEES